MKITGYLLGVLFIALVYQFMNEDVSFMKALILSFAFSWLFYLLFHFLGMIKWKKKNRL